MIALVHAFSRRNAGDSLLVDLALKRLERAGIPPGELWIFALDADSFHDLEQVVSVPGEPWGRMSPSLLSAGTQLLASGFCWMTGGRVAPGSIAGKLAAADGIVAVGGGYLRAGTIVNSLGVVLNHVPQLAVAAAIDAPSIYLPQSIGPMRGPAGCLVLRLLRDVDTVFVRDDQSLREVGRHRKVERMPDLAVLALAERGIAPKLAGGNRTTLLVARDLGRDEGYLPRLQELGRRLQPVEWPVQARGLGGRSDTRFYERLGARPSKDLVDALGSGHGTVVSVRLHGALQALLHGWPAIHLAYQRKGWGAYADLGLEEFVHDARSFDPDQVIEQVRSLTENPEPYWDRVEACLSGLESASQSLQARLREFAEKTGHAPGI